MFLSDPGDFISGKIKKENPEMQSHYMGMWLEYVCVIDHMLGQCHGMGPDVWWEVSYSD